MTDCFYCKKIISIKDPKIAGHPDTARMVTSILNKHFDEGIHPLKCVQSLILEDNNLLNWVHDYIATLKNNDLGIFKRAVINTHYRVNHYIDVPDTKWVRWTDLMSGIKESREYKLLKTSEIKYPLFISHNWLSKDHPDAHGETLPKIKKIIEVYKKAIKLLQLIKFTKISFNDQRYPKIDIRVKDFMYVLNKFVMDTTDVSDDDIHLWYDYAVMPQNTPLMRNLDEELYFKSQLKQINFIIKSVPICFITNSLDVFVKRGWCLAELSIAIDETIHYLAPDESDLLEIMVANLKIQSTLQMFWAICDFSINKAINLFLSIGIKCTNGSDLPYLIDVMMNDIFEPDSKMEGFNLNSRSLFWNSSINMRHRSLFPELMNTIDPDFGDRNPDEVELVVNIRTNHKVMCMKGIMSGLFIPIFFINTFIYKELQILMLTLQMCDNEDMIDEIILLCNINERVRKLIINPTPIRINFIESGQLLCFNSIDLSF